jgi:hypothetical protein
MNKFTLLISTCLALLMLSACSHNGSRYRAQVDNCLTQEDWMQRINTSAKPWMSQGDRWFFTGQPSRFSQIASSAPINKAMSATVVNVANFNKINVNGPFELQIFGHSSDPTVYVMGSNQAVRQAAIEVHHDTLYINLAPNCSPRPKEKIIVRVGMRELNGLVAQGCAKVEGTQIYSRHLDITTLGSANVLLDGDINLSNVNSVANGTITVIGAYTPSLNIRAVTNGSVNVSGRVGIHHLIKNGGGNVNIIGADSDALDIQSGGFGNISIAGFVNLTHLNAYQRGRVYIYWVNSNGMYVNVHDSAVVGLAGVTKNMDLETDGAARFQGKYLRSGNTYVRSHQASHANINPSEKLFANATDNSSIYFFGSPNVVSRYTLNNGLVVPVWSNACPTPSVPPPSSWSWGHGARYKAKAPRVGNPNKPCCSY